MALALMNGSARALAFTVMWAALAQSVATGADPPENGGFHSGKAFRQALDRTISATWEQVDLRTITRRIEETRQIALLVDRRLDPSRPVKFAAHDVRLGELLERLASERDAEAIVVGNTVYLGPKSATEKLRTLIALRTEELARIKPARRSGLNPSDVRWDDLTTPGELVSRLSQRDQVRIEGIDQVPHDLWAAATLPSVNLVEAFSLILIQFDLTFHWIDGGSGVEIEPAPERVVIERHHAVRKGTLAKKGANAALLDEVKERYPGLSASLAAEGIKVEGTIEQHEEIERFLGRGEPGLKSPDRAGSKTASKEKKARKESEIRYTLRMQDKPLGSLLKTLERPEHGGWKFEFRNDELTRAGIRLDQRITFDVREVAIAELLKTALDQAGLQFQIQDRVVRLSPKSTDEAPN
ncbi:MAG: hypothetical protein NT069_07390 [Planctomycetota bacterium]|nr:hypothetical protein [Planctomycetota bacterium]